MADVTDAVVIGGGINGLVAAAELAGAGWTVRLFERGERLGGFIASAERTLPGYVHDTFASWHPLFTSGPAYAALGDALRWHGLTYRNTDGPLTASVADDGRAVVADRDPEATAKGFAHAADRDRYLRMLRDMQRHAPLIGALMSTELRSARALRPAAALVRALGLAGTERCVRDLVTSGRSWCRREFDGHEVDHLMVPWLLHTGLSPDHASGGLMVPLLAASLHGFGLPIVAGGSGRFVDAFCSLLRERGVHVHTSAEVEEIVVKRGRATAVVVDGERHGAGRAVLASVGPRALYGTLLPAGAVGAAVSDEVRRFRPGRAGMQIHVALSGPLQWRDERLRRVPLVHVSDGSASTGIACAQAEAGLLPDRPTVVVGQQHLLDPSRAPRGAAALWIQLQEVPFRPSGDAAGELPVADGWDARLADCYARRVLARVARHSPDLDGKVLAMDVLTPVDIAAANPNAVDGDPYAGSTEFDQNFVWRPVPSAARHHTAVRRLWHIGASTHPGAGLSGGSGHLVAQALLAADRRRPNRRASHR
ncbi:NAD(P)/FAD-dependent oxidoreductase [Streptomyces sp. TS71-3]|uniref:phytoene desaturase family protein n=1 Tax=Streptomyces sp. TS71-3 TaxID=2733862 RepID=UPI001B2526CA|nr:NAD(P)/FAD-dependent oxidoreductase [Streptomyces sp. TS71-3]GHJ39386.1 FAD-dependent oxidoreductase [Streptomyces sp. TS71-3]